MAGFQVIGPDPARGQEIVRAIRDRVELPRRFGAMEAAGAVLCVLAQRLTGGEADKLVGELPAWLREMVRPCARHEADVAAAFGRDELLRRVAAHLEIGEDDAEAIAAAVFAAVRRQITDREIRGVASQLPADLRELWHPPQEGPVPPKWRVSGREPVEAAPPPAAPDATSSHPAAAEVERSGAIPAGVTGGGAISAVMCTLTQRISGGEAEALASSLPDALQALVGACATHRGERPGTFGKTEFLRRVGAHLGGIPEPEAEIVARAVFAAVERAVPDRVRASVAAQLPPDLEAMWCRPGEAPDPGQHPA